MIAVEIVIKAFVKHGTGVSTRQGNQYLYNFLYADDFSL